MEDKIFRYISAHEVLISDEMEKINDIPVKFTTFGNRVACRAVREIIQLLDDETKLKVIEMMGNKLMK